MWSYGLIKYSIEVERKKKYFKLLFSKHLCFSPTSYFFLSLGPLSTVYIIGFGLLFTYKIIFITVVILKTALFRGPEQACQCLLIFLTDKYQETPCDSLICPPTNFCFKTPVYRYIERTINKSRTLLSYFKCIQTYYV